MDYKKTITEQDILSARAYMPLSEKMAFVDKAANDCVYTVEVKTDISGTVVRNFKDATDKKSCWLMAALCGYYLSGDNGVKASDIDRMSVSEYDEISEAHIFNQLERMKSKGAEVRDKVFDILADYRDLEKRLNTELYNILQALNGTVIQALDQLEISMSPERIEQMTKDFNTAKEQLSEITAAKKNGEK